MASAGTDSIIKESADDEDAFRYLPEMDCRRYSRCGGGARAGASFSAAPSLPDSPVHYENLEGSDALSRADGGGRCRSEAGALAERPLARLHSPNVEHVSWVGYEQLPGELHRASCALGIFGTSAKAQRVIPNKVFQAIACGTPVVTADTPAIRELLRDGESAVLVRPGDPEALVEGLRRATPAIGEGGLAAYQAHASEAVLGARWRDLIQSLL